MGFSRRMTKMFWRKDRDCPEVRELSSEFLEGGLPPSSQTKIQAHLRVCPACTAFIKSLASTISLLGKLPKSKPPSSLKRNIRERVGNKR